MSHTPSAEQLAQFQRIEATRPVALFYEYSAAAGDAVLPQLTKIAKNHGASLIWAAREDQVFVGRLPEFQHAALIAFDHRDAASEMINDAAHGALMATLSQVQVAVLGPQPSSIARLSNLLARVLPCFPFDKSVDDSEEPGVGTSTVMPSAAAIAQLKAHPQPQVPVVMINWFKYRDRAAYMKYGKVALQCTHSSGAKLVYISRYHQLLIGNGGDPATNLWDEFGLMQYPGRCAFTHMTTLKRYRKALHHRESGLAEYGQGLTVTQPREEFIWRK